MPAPSIVQTSAEVNIVSSSTGQVTMPGVAAGNMLVIQLAMASAAVRLFTVADDVNGSWSVAEEVNSGQTAHISYRANTGAGDTLVTVSVTSGFTASFRFRVHEVSGADTAAPFDVSSELVEGSNTNNHACAATAAEIDTAPNVIVFCVGLLNSGASICSAGAGYTEVTAALADRILWQYKTSTSALVDEQGVWTNTGTARQGRSVMASFKAPAAGGSSILRQMMHLHG